MTEIVIVKSVTGIYHLCRWDKKKDIHYSFQEFENLGLAKAIGIRMNGGFEVNVIEASNG